MLFSTRLRYLGVALVASVLMTVGLAAGGSVPAHAAGTGVITGTAYLGSHQNIAGAGDVQVHWTLLNQGISGYAATDARGEYSVEGLDPGLYIVYFKYVGSGSFGGVWAGDHPSYYTSSPVSVGASSPTTINPILPARVSWSGNVSLGSAGMHPAGVPVTVDALFRPGNGESSDEQGTTTDANGDFTLHLVPGANYDISAWTSSGYQGGSFGTVAVTTAASGQNITLEPTGSVTVNVFLGSTSTPAPDGSVVIGGGVQTGCAGSVCGGSGSLTSTPVSHGSAVFTNLTDGIYSFTSRYAAGDGRFQASTTQPEVKVTHGVADHPTLSIVLDPTRTLTGTVTFSSGESPANHPVTVRAELNATPSAAAVQTDSSGRFSISGLSDGAYWLFFHDPSGTYPDTWYPSDPQWAPATLDVHADTTVGTVVLSRAKVSGSVSSVPSGTFQDWRVFAQLPVPDGKAGPHIVATAPIDASGAWSFPALAPGSYTFGYGTNASSMPITALGADPTSRGTTFVVSANSDIQLGADVVRPQFSATGAVSTVSGQSLAVCPADRWSNTLKWRPDPSTPWKSASAVSLYPTFWSATLYAGQYILSIRCSDDDGFLWTGDSPVFTVGPGATNSASVVLHSTAPVSPHAALVKALYTDYLGRGPSASEVDGWASALDRGAPSTAISLGFVNSDEYRLLRIEDAYQTILGRASEPAGRQNWLNAMRTGQTTTDGPQKLFYQSDEFWNNAQAQYTDQPAGASRWIASLYHHLLNRAPDGGGMSNWLAVLASRGRGAVVDGMWGATELARARVSAMYQLYLGRTPDPTGLATWVAVNLGAGDSATRVALTSSAEYAGRAVTRFS